MTAKTATDFEKTGEILLRALQALQMKLDPKPYFNGRNFSIIDAAYAPIFYRFNLLKPHLEHQLMNDFPKAKKWGEALNSRTSVAQAIGGNFYELLVQHLHSNGAYL